MRRTTVSLRTHFTKFKSVVDQLGTTEAARVLNMSSGNINRLLKVGRSANVYPETLQNVLTAFENLGSTSVPTAGEGFVLIRLSTLTDFELRLAALSKELVTLRANPISIA